MVNTTHNSGLDYITKSSSVNIVVRAVLNANYRLTKWTNSHGKMTIALLPFHF